MSKHLSAGDIERYKQQVMSPAELLMLDDHIAECDSCRKRLEQSQVPGPALEYIWAALNQDADNEPQHLTFEQLTSYVDDQMSAAERKRVAQHLTICPHCEAEAKDLGVFIGVMERPAEDYLSKTSTTPLQKIAAFKLRPARRSAIEIGTLVAIAALLLLLVALPLRRQISDLQNQLSDVRQANQKLEAELSRSQQEAEKIMQDNELSRSALADLESQLANLQATNVEAGVKKSGAFALNDGDRQIVFDGNGNIVGVESLPRGWQSAVKAALLTQKVSTPQFLAELRGNSFTLLSGSNSKVPFALINPIGRIIESDRPTFRWQKLNGATSYTVEVFDSEFNVVAKSDPISETEWTPARSLPRGAIYTWQVTAIKDGEQFLSPTPPAKEAKFKVLEQAAINELKRAREDYPNSHLVLGVLYARAGLLNEAEREFQIIVNANPQSAIAVKLLRSVKSQRK